MVYYNNTLLNTTTDIAKLHIPMWTFFVFFWVIFFIFVEYYVEIIFIIPSVFFFENNRIMSLIYM